MFSQDEEFTWIQGSEEKECYPFPCITWTDDEALVKVFLKPQKQVME